VKGRYLSNTILIDLEYSAACIRAM
jgi:hypothetical protein